MSHVSDSIGKSIEESFSLGLGLLMYSREKIENLVEELVDKGDVAKKDARQLAGKVIKQGEEQREELKKMIQKETADALDHLNVVQRKDILTKDEIRELVREEIQKSLQDQGGLPKENGK